MNAEDVEQIKRHFNVVAEGLRHDLQQVAEGHQVILNQVQQFREEVKEEFKEVRTLLNKNSLSYSRLQAWTVLVGRISEA